MDQAAQHFETLYMSCYAPLMRFAARRVGDEDAADIVAETFTIAWRRLHQLHSENPLPWLYGIARNVIANHIRSRFRRNRLTQRVAAASPTPVSADHADQVLQRLHLDSAVAELSERDREALRLAEWEQLAPAEAAIVLGCSTTAYKVRLHRARRRLAALLAAEPSEGSATHGHEVPTSKILPMSVHNASEVAE